MEQILSKTITQLCRPGKGILAADESTGTIGKRFSTINVENSLQNRIEYRDMLFTTKGLQDHLSGVIIYDEMLFATSDNKDQLIKPLIDNGICIGIKNDRGLRDLYHGSSEKLTMGLNDLYERNQQYFKAGARFAKWRCVYNVPSSDLVIKENAMILAQYSKISQMCGLVPIIEPEVLLAGNHTSNQCFDTLYDVLKAVYKACDLWNVDLKYTILKTNFVVPGSESEDFCTINYEMVAKLTWECFRDTVPKDVPGIFFLSGGLTELQATKALKSINTLKLSKGLTKFEISCGISPHKTRNNMETKLFSFSYGRALQASVLKKWQGTSKNIDVAQKTLLKRCKECSQHVK